MIGKIFLKNKRTKNTKSGFTTEKWVLRTCDECGIQEEVRNGAIVKGRKKRGKKIDLCKKCSYLTKYKFSPFELRMENSVNWKGGRSIDRGYKKIYIGGGKRIFEHVRKYEEYIGRKLLLEECLHHIDLNKANNEIDNLFLCKNKSDHLLVHYSLQIVAASFLNKLIWFDYCGKKYIMSKPNIFDRKIEKNIILPPKIHIHTMSGEYRKRQYYRFYIKGGHYKAVHIYIAEKMIGRKLYASECVHHINMRTLDNSIDNLCILNRSEHSCIHKLIEKCGIILYKMGIIKFDRGQYCV